MVRVNEDSILAADESDFDMIQGIYTGRAQCSII